MSKRGVLNRQMVKLAAKARDERLLQRRVELARMEMQCAMIRAQTENMRSLRETPPMVVYDA